MLVTPLSFVTTLMYAAPLKLTAIVPDINDVRCCALCFRKLENEFIVFITHGNFFIILSIYMCENDSALAVVKGRYPIEIQNKIIPNLIL